MLSERTRAAKQAITPTLRAPRRPYRPHCTVAVQGHCSGPTLSPGPGPRRSRSAGGAGDSEVCGASPRHQVRPGPPSYVPDGPGQSGARPSALKSAGRFNPGLAGVEGRVRAAAATVNSAGPAETGRPGSARREGVARGAGLPDPGRGPGRSPPFEGTCQGGRMRVAGQMCCVCVCVCVCVFVCVCACVCNVRVWLSLGLADVAEADRVAGLGHLVRVVDPRHPAPHARSYTRTHARSYTRTHARKHARKQARMQAHAHAHATHTQLPPTHPSERSLAVFQRARVRVCARVSARVFMRACGGRVVANGTRPPRGFQRANVTRACGVRVPHALVRAHTRVHVCARYHGGVRWACRGTARSSSASFSESRVGVHHEKPG